MNEVKLIVKDLKFPQNSFEERHLGIYSALEHIAQIYDAVVVEENLNALISGKEIDIEFHQDQRVKIQIK